MYLGSKCIPYITFIAVLTILDPAFLFAQDGFSYSRSLKLGEYQTKATYTYNLVKGDTILNGPFKLESNSLETLLEGHAPYISLAGNFISGKTDSLWQFEFGEFKAEPDPIFIDYQVKVSLSGIQQTSVAMFSKGIAQGKWSHKIESVQNSSVQDVIFESEVSFEEGIPQGIIRIKNSELNLLGRFLRNGLAHDIWELSFDEDPERMEQWYFSNGRLEKILIQKNQITDTLKIYSGKIKYSSTFNLDESYFQILSLQNVFDSSAYVESGGKVLGLLKEHAAYYQKVEKVFSDLKSFAGDVSVPEFGVSIAHFPLNKEDFKVLESIRANLQQIHLVKLRVLENTRLNLLKHSDEEIMFLLAAVEEIGERYILSAKKVLEYDQKSILEFVPRANLIPGSNPEQNPFGDINISYQGPAGTKTRAFAISGFEVKSNKSNEFGQLANISQYALQCLDSIEAQLRFKLSDFKSQQELEELEKDLLLRTNQTTALLDSIEYLLDKPYQQAFTALRTSMSSEIRKYSKEEDPLVKPGQIRELISCLGELEALASSLAKLPEQQEEIQSLYKEQVWNPFTATIMDDQVKERVAEAYSKILVPFILGNIEKELECNNIQEYHKVLDLLYDRMKQLRTQNTSKLERKLKNESNPETVMKLFEISM